MLPEAWGSILQLGVSGVLLLVLYLVTTTGQLRTRFEAQAWEDRAKRAESQVDRLIPAVEQTNEAVAALVSQNQAMMAAMQHFMERVDSVQLRSSERRG